MFLKPYTLRNILRKFNFKSRSQPAMVIVKHMWGLRSAIMFRSQASKLQYLSLGCGRIPPQNIVNKWLEHAAVVKLSQPQDLGGMIVKRVTNPSLHYQ